MQNDNDAGIELTAQQVWRIKRLLERSTDILTRLIRITDRAKRWFQASSVTPVFAKNWIVEYLTAYRRRYYSCNQRQRCYFRILRSTYRSLMPTLIPNQTSRRRILSRFCWFHQYIEFALARFELTARNLIWFAGLLHIDRRQRIAIGHNVDLVRATLRDLSNTLMELEDDLTPLIDIL